MNKNVLITGASKGIGRAIAIESALLGFDIVVHYNKDKAGAEATAERVKELGQHASILSFDISNREQTKAVLEKDIEENGMYYGIVCNAGVTADAAFPALEDSEWDTVINTNLNGFYNVVKPLVMPMVRTKKPGRIVTLSSVSGITGNRGQVNYSASKAGIIGATKALAVELGKRDITVNCVAPGIIESEMTENIEWDRIKPSIPLNRMGKPEEVGALVAFLLSDKASYISRQVLSVNGGMI
ncbi:MAG: 3-oxoacyl-ACP reductase FabG [Fibrobacterales bacterium]